MKHLMLFFGVFATGVFLSFFISDESVSRQETHTEQLATTVTPYETLLATTNQSRFSNEDASFDDTELNARFAGLLSHVRWLIANQDGTGQPDVRYKKRDDSLVWRQIDSLMDDSSEDFRDIAEEFDTSILTVNSKASIASSLSVAGTSTLANVIATSLTFPSVTPSITTNLLYNTAGDLYWGNRIVSGSTTGAWISNGSDIYRSDGNVGVRTGTPLSFLQVGDFASTDISSWPTGNIFSVSPMTLNDTSGVASGKVFNRFGAITLTAPTPQTYSNVTNLSIDAPIAGSNVTISKNLALRVLGNSQFHGLNIFGSITGNAPNASLGVYLPSTPTTWSPLGIGLNIRGDTVTDTFSPASTTISIRAVNAIAAPTIASTNTLTLNTAATLQITGSPIAGTNTTIGRPLSLLVAGNTVFSALNLLGSSTGNPPAASADIYLPTSPALWSNGIGLRVSSGGGTITDTFSPASTISSRILNSIGTHALASTNLLTITNASTFEISGAPTASTNTTITNPMAFRVAAGVSSFGGNVIVRNTGDLTIGGLASGLQVHGNTAANSSLAISGFNATAATAPTLNFYRSRNTTIGAANVAISGDTLGSISWFGAQQTGTFSNQNPAAAIQAFVDGTVTSGAAGDMPGRLVFSTTPDGSGSTTERMRITNAGNVGIGTTTASARLTVAGTVRFANITSGTLQADALGNITVSSDERLKDVAGTFEAGLEKIVGIEPILYNWKKSSGFDTKTTYAGFSAQNVRDFLPEAVGENPDGFLTLSDRPILAALVNAVKEMWQRLTGVEGRVDKLEQRVLELEAALNEVQSSPSSSLGGSNKSQPSPVQVTEPDLELVPVSVTEIALPEETVEVRPEIGPLEPVL